ncbi:hypothetical protein T265_01319 [Opisthorchis viverrini]|uniref:Uncharacterized protein n=1 Tax=Opisthorchis viverrini TaxID=6198 RepID=A0A075A319_OPIVI|nr:hypothetical protein T265_01319 [Opisthorchis viverrini]KER32632.1 hypothetical protein T265_01319 [Opisthorchis viverrini]
MATPVNFGGQHKATRNKGTKPRYEDANTLIYISTWFSPETQVNLSCTMFCKWVYCTKAVSCFSWYDIRDIAVYFRKGNTNHHNISISVIKTYCQNLNTYDLKTETTFIEKCTQLQINLVFTGDSSESLVYDVLQLNVLHTGHLMF